MTHLISAYLIPQPVLGPGPGVRSRGYIFTENWAREAITPTGWPTLYTAAETGAGGSSGMSTTLNRIQLTTDVLAGDDQDVRLSGIRIERNLCSLVTGLPQLGTTTSQVQLDIPFAIDSAADGEAFIGLHSNVAALTALPTTARHMGVYWDISAGANFTLTAADGTTQSTIGTTVAVDTNIHILRITWTGEDAATLQLYTAAGATEGTGQTVAAFNGTTGQSHELHFFVQAEAGGARLLRVYQYRIAWT